MCTCETGCLSKKCSCNKAGLKCSASCKCINCLNGGRGPLNNNIEAELKSMKSTIQQAIEAVQTIHQQDNVVQPTTIQQFFLDPRLSSIAQVHHQQSAPAPHNSPIMGGRSPSSKKFLVNQPEVMQLDLHSSSSPLAATAASSSSSSSSTPSYCNRFSFIKCGGVTNFFDAVVREKFYLVQEDQYNRLYNWNYPGNNQVAMQLWAKGLPDMTVEVKIVSQSAEILKEFVNFLQNNFE